MQFGAHVSIKDGVYNAPYNGRAASCDVVQIFTKSSNQWRAKPLTDDDVEKFIAAQDQTGVAVVCAHDSYLINLASPKSDLFEKSYAAFVEEMIRCDCLVIPNLVMHPGSHVGEGEEAGLKRIIEAFNRMIDENPDSKATICLENTAGQGTNLGYRFEHLAEIIDGVEAKHRFAVCLDTCHTFTAGYPLAPKNNFLATLREFDKIVGIDKLRIIHMNDSKREAGSRVDRHEWIGDGELGLEPFEYIVNDRRLKKIPMILETPKTSADDDIHNLKILRSLVKRRKGQK